MFIESVITNVWIHVILFTFVIYVVLSLVSYVSLSAATSQVGPRPWPGGTLVGEWEGLCCPAGNLLFCFCEVSTAT